MTAPKLRYVMRHALAGVVAFAAAQVLLLLIAGWAEDGGRPAFEDRGWFLNSGIGVVIMGTCVSLASAVTAAVLPAAGLWHGAAAFAAGAAAAMVIAVFILGPGSIFPIVIAVGTMVLAGATIVGAMVGAAVRRRVFDSGR